MDPLRANGSEQNRLRSDALRLEGNRVLYEFDGKQREFVGVVDRDQNVTVTIQLDRPPSSKDEAMAVLARVFCQTPEDIASATPEFWNGYLKEIEASLQPKKPETSNAGQEPAQPHRPRAVAASGGEKVYHLGESGVTPPKPLYAPEPTFTEVARKFRHQGVAGFNVVVDRSGKISQVELASALGMGLDEVAADTIRTWRFEPAKLNQELVNVIVYIEVSFHLFDR